MKWERKPMRVLHNGPLRMDPTVRRGDLGAALGKLKEARTLTKYASAPQAHKAIQRAINSVEGAIRHADRRVREHERSIRKELDL